MININLLPVELRPVKKKKKKAAKEKSPVVFSPNILYIKIGVAVLIAIFVVITIIKYFDYLEYHGKEASVTQAHNEIQPKVQELRKIESTVSSILQPEKEFLNTNVLNKAPITSILQVISEKLPDGVWLTSFAISNSGEKRSFQLKGVALDSQSQTNIQQIEEYLQNIKEVIPSSSFVYSTGKQLKDSVSSTAFNATFQWQAD